ncbi:MAG TPA: hypothetical protein VF753_02690 [Terriglobales bacterium]
MLEQLQVEEIEFSQDQPQSTPSALEDRTYKRVRLVCWLVCIAFALIEAWSQRMFINEDGISYLDMSDYLLRHNWHLLVNPIWSPLYPILIGIVTWFARPTGLAEGPVVHVINFVIFLGALASFEFLLRQVISVLGPESERSKTSIPVWAWQLLGYSFFAWSTFGMLWAPRMVTPDLLVTAFVFLDCGLLLSLRSGNKLLRTCLLLGVALGLGYYAKAILFPLAFVFIFLALFMIGNLRKSLLPLALTSLIFIGISAPLLIAMSKRVGHPSYSEVGNLNYAWHVNHAGAGKLAGGPFFYSESGPPAYLKHPATLLHAHPDAFEIREPIAYTYAPRQDMEYWSAGTRVVFNWRNQMHAIFDNLKLLFVDSHNALMIFLIIAGFAFALARPDRGLRLRKMLHSLPFFVLSLIAISLYMLIAVEPRYIAPFLVLILLGMLPGVLVANTKQATKRTVLTMNFISAALVIFTAMFVGYHLAGFPRGFHGDGLDVYARVGTYLNTAGVNPGDEIAIIGDSSDGDRWARAARVRIVAQILREDVKDFWAIPDATTRGGIYDAFARTGARAVIAEDTPPPSALAEWQQLGNSHYYVHFLNSSERN